MHQDVERFQMHPHGGNRIGQTPVRERISRQKKTEFVVNERFGNRQPGQDSKAQGQCREAAKRNAQGPPSGQGGQRTFRFQAHLVPKLGTQQRQQQRD